MPETTTVIIGAGHCGLAMSHCLAARSIDHVVLERGQVANSWRTQRWDSLRLLTPNWMTRLPGYAYRGADPDGYLSARQVTAMLADYAEASAAPVLTGTTVTSVRAAGGGYVVSDRPGQLARADGGAGLRGGDGARGASAGAAGAGRDHLGHPGGLPQPGPAAPGRRAGGRRLGQRGPARRRAGPLRAPGHPRRRRARPHAAHLPRPGHLVVAGRRRGAGPALRRGRRSGAGAERAVHAADRLAGPDGRPERVDLGRGAAGRPPGRNRRTAWPSSPARCPTCARWPT